MFNKYDTVAGDENVSTTAIDKLFLFMVFLIPFIPRPTIDHPAKYLAPVVIAAVLYIYMIWFLGRKVRTRVYGGRSALLGSILAFVLLVYLARILANGEWDELPHFIGRSLASFLMVALLSWMNIRGMKVKDVYRPLFFSSIAVSLLVIFIGITGIPLFGADSARPPRTYGVKLPFFDTVAIPRSTGEFGIIISAAWAYFLIYKEEYSRKLRWAIGIVLLMAVVISQSRSTYLGAIMVTSGYFLLQLRATKRLVAGLLVAALMMPVVIELIPKDLPVMKSFVSEGIYQWNVDERYDQYTAALNAITENPTVFFAGVQHTEWTDYSKGMVGEGRALHNHFLSILVFLGLVGGIVNLIVYLLPIMNLINAKDYSNKDVSLMLLVSSGMLVGLNFYEAFFSMVTALNISVMWYSFTLLNRNTKGGDVVR